MGASPSLDRAAEPLSAKSTKLRFSNFCLDIRSGELSSGDRTTYLQQQPLEVLRMLLEHRGEMVARKDLQQRLWPGLSSGDLEHGLNKAVQKLRLALGDDVEHPICIDTVPRRGYRFIAEIEPVVQPEADPKTQVSARLSSKTLTPKAFAFAGVTLLIVIAVYLGLFTLKEASPPKDGRQRLVVIPFQDLSGDPGQQYFTDGLTDEIIVQLGRLNPRKLGVIARTSAMSYRKENKTAAQIGRELKVDYILEGTIRRDAERVRITAQLIRVSDQAQVWGESFEREVGSILLVQSDIGQKVARQIGVQLAAGTPHPEQLRPISHEAHEEFLRGLYLWSSGEREVQESVSHFQRAIALEPNYAAAHAWLAFSYNKLGSGELLPPKEAYSLARASALKALEIDPSLPEAHAALGFILRTYDWDWQGAERELTEALQLDPNNATAHHVYALYLSTVGRHDEAIEAMSRAAELDPLSPLATSQLAVIYTHGRKYDLARAIWQSRPDLQAANAMWGRFLLLVGENELALHNFQAIQAKSPRLGILGEQGRAYIAMGRTVEGRKILEKLRVDPAARHTLSPYIAQLHADLGEKDEAFRWLEIAQDEHAARLIFLKVDPAWDSLRGDPRFQRLLRRMNL